MKPILLFMILFTQAALAGMSIHNDVEEKSFYLEKMEGKIPANIEALTERDLESYFDEDNSLNYCESTILQSLSAKYGARNLKFVLLKARKLDLIDDVVMDILFPAAYKIGSVSLPSDSDFQIRKGTEKLSTFYKNLFQQQTCAIEQLVILETEVASKDTPEDVMLFLHNWAKKRKLITDDQFQLLAAISDTKDKITTLRLAEYASKRERLRSQMTTSLEKGNTLSQRTGKVSDFKFGYRHQLYSAFTITQLKSLSKVMAKLNQRMMSDKAEITFYSKTSGDEKVELGPMEQVRLSLKMYQREKKILQLDEELKGKPITYQHFLTLAFETGKITPKDFDYLVSLPGLWDQKKTTLEKIRDFSNSYGFVIPVLTGPVGGYAYMLGISLLNNYVENEKKKNDPLGDFSHDLFYGSCDVKTL